MNTNKIIMKTDNVFFIICFTIILNIEIGLSENDYCMSKDKNPYNLYGSKTDYEFVRGNLETVQVDPQCKPIQFWALNRHGTRFTKHFETLIVKQAKRIKSLIEKNIEQGRKPDLCPEDLKKLMEWQYDPKIEDKESELTEQGVSETIKLARRFKKKYPDLLGNYSKSDFYFRPTNEERTKSTNKAYITGLFGNDTQQVEIDSSKCKDTIIRSYDTCPLWILKVSSNKTQTQLEQNIFRNQPEYLKFVGSVSKRLGFSTLLSNDDIQTMYDVCRFEKSWKPRNLSPWCSVFIKKEFTILDYLDDLGQFYQNGYGHPYHPKLGCRPLTDMMNRFSKTISSGEVHPKVVAFFTHHTMLNMVLTKLNYGNDGKMLKGSHYEEMMTKRKYLSSKNMPFGANLVAVLHRCPDMKYVIQFYLNERPMELQGCPKGLCSWGSLNKLLHDIKQCDLDFCYKLT